MEQIAILMFQVPGGGGYNMTFKDIMDLDINWKNYLLEKGEDWFTEYERKIEEDAS